MIGAARSRRRGARDRWLAPMIAVLLAVPTAALLASFGAQAAGADVTTFPITARAAGITPGPDGALWITTDAADGVHHGTIKRVTYGGIVTATYTNPGIVNPGGVTVGPDGA